MLTATAPTVVPEEQYGEVKGKLRSLAILKKHPRAFLPELEMFLKAVEMIYSTAETLRQSAATKENTEQIKALMSRSNCYEDILIRVVLGGEKLVDVLGNNSK
ncbi:hypothetical protein GCK72_005017 [Caenorhabditis remanei]|uniref:Uncharacterized protein n=1 Tax=Caenorhabditis remanei TaxID=31234 RepID=A0A6A5HE27_CAERE|nr:hypothetical protein GCK72_005017 [Caenorhabditis remanei]KAF1765066.1 hypothetical protein GCK72_005017 [Caenorhabditis remanei]